jgi:hypothetical protein
MTIKWKNDFYIIDTIRGHRMGVVPIIDSISPIVLNEGEIIELEYPPASKSDHKTPFELLDLGFAAAMCHSWQLGVKHGRTANDWQHLPRTDETRDRYVAKILRHLQGYVEAGDDRAVKCEHLAAIACDANILWHVRSNYVSQNSEHTDYASEGATRRELQDQLAALRAENEKKLIYLGCPYSHPDPHVKTQRFEAVTKVASKMMAKGEFVFSPISHTHPIAMAGGLPGGWEFWKEYDEIYLRMSCKMVVLTLDGWRESVGLMAEIELSRKLGVEVEYVETEGRGE